MMNLINMQPIINSPKVISMVSTIEKDRAPMTGVTQNIEARSMIPARPGG